MHSPTVENYLKALLQLAVPGRGVSTNDLASRLSVKPASVTDMLKRLADRRLIAYEPYQGARLTEDGRLAAAGVLRRHRILELFLHKTCEMSLDRVHDEAERLEHASSDEFIDALDRLLGHPRLDPHGDPIPGRDGTLRDDPSPTLADLPAGAEVQLTRVDDDRPEALRFLVKEGLVPGARVKVLRRLEFDGSLEVRVSRRRVILSAELSRGVRVRVERKDKR